VFDGLAIGNRLADSHAMTEIDDTVSDAEPLTGGCLCGALRYRASGPPLFAGHCYCRDCQRSSGAGFIPFLGFAAEALSIDGESRSFAGRLRRGRPATRNVCSHCNSLVFGGERGQSSSYTIYAGTLDDPARFTPQMAIFDRDRPAWSPLPPGLQVFATMPDEPPD